MLILVRHGRTVLNATGRLQGRIDTPLDEVGLAQAAAVAARVGPVDELISSPLARAQQTADAFGVAYTVDARWVELSYGIHEGTEVHATPSEVWDSWRADPWFAPVGGESLGTLDLRVRTACVELAARIGDLDVAVVSHVSPIKAAVAWALGTDVSMAWRSHLSVASICRIEMRRTGPVLTAFNEVVG